MTPPPPAAPAPSWPRLVLVEALQLPAVALVLWGRWPGALWAGALFGSLVCCALTDSGWRWRNRLLVLQAVAWLTSALVLSQTPPSASPEARLVTITITYQGDLRCRVVHDPSGTVLVSDAPLDNQGRGESFSPTDLVASGLGCCMTTIMGIVARRDGIALAGAALRVEKHMTAAAPRKIARLVLAFSMPAGIRADDRPKLERAAHACPVALSLHPDIAVEAAFSYPD